MICWGKEKCSQVPATVTLIYSILLVSSSMIATCNYLSQPHAMDPVMRNTWDSSDCNGISVCLACKRINAVKAGNLNLP